VVLTNPRYTGLRVWSKQRKDEVLIDVDDVALRRETKMRWNNQDASAAMVHQPLVTGVDFRQVQMLIGGKRIDRPRSQPSRTRHPYQLRGLLFCGICGRRMQGSWNNDKPHYRCVHPTEYGLANATAHPRTVYLRRTGHPDTRPLAHAGVRAQPAAAHCRRHGQRPRRAARH
jgi:hypothetical protein